MMKADRIIVDAAVVDPASGSFYQGLAIVGDSIVALGSQEEIRELRGPRTQVDSLSGTTVLPGFCDSHLHYVGTGLARMGADLNPEAGVTDMESLISALLEQARKVKPGQWITGRGFDDLRLRERRYPTAEDLDQVSTSHPVMIRRSCGHMSVVNTRAMEIIGLTSATPDPEGGKIERDDGGNPTGVLREKASALVDQSKIYGREDYLKALELARQALLTKGITSAHTMDSEWIALAGDLEKMQDNSPRLYLTLSVASPQELMDSPIYRMGFSSGFGTDSLRLGPVKVMLDGSDDSGTALMHKPYEGRQDLGTGMAVVEATVAGEVVRAAHARGFQVAIHAIGDLAVDLAAEMIERAMQDSPRPDPRHRIEHCSFLTPLALSAIGRSGLVAAVQPPFIPMMDQGYRSLLGPERMERGYLFKTLLGLARAVPGGSDTPVASMDVVRGIRAAVNRRQGDGVVSGPEEKVSLMEALAMYTIHGAIASFHEKRTGSLAPGKLADLVVLDQELGPHSTNLETDTRVVATMLGGQWVYRAPKGFPG